MREILNSIMDQHNTFARVAKESPGKICCTKNFLNKITLRVSECRGDDRIIEYEACDDAQLNDY